MNKNLLDRKELKRLVAKKRKLINDNIGLRIRWKSVQSKWDSLRHAILENEREIAKISTDLNGGE